MSSKVTPTLRECWPTSSPWTEIVEPLFEKREWLELEQFVADERNNHRVYPPADEVFAAFSKTPPAAVRAVILGQDPYHGSGQAHGLSFSVRSGVRLPPSLRNIFVELESDLGIPIATDGDLTRWAESGVLLLNSVLTVRAENAHSHQGRGWEWFTDQIINAVSEMSQPVVFLLWGKPAQKKSGLISDQHLKIESAHPSPLSAWRGFFGSRPFSQTNNWLIAQNSKPVDWPVNS